MTLYTLSIRRPVLALVMTREATVQASGEIERIPAPSAPKATRHGPRPQ